ncbi:uncharacterized protein LOC144312493 isoform X3 [Canis aureus]
MIKQELCKFGPFLKRFLKNVKSCEENKWVCIGSTRQRGRNIGQNKVDNILTQQFHALLNAHHAEAKRECKLQSSLEVSPARLRMKVVRRKSKRINRGEN